MRFDVSFQRKTSNVKILHSGGDEVVMDIACFFFLSIPHAESFRDA